MNKIFIHKRAFSADDVLRGADQGDINRSHACTPQIWRWDNQNAVIYTATQCALSRNAWQQEIQLMDYNYIVPEEERIQVISFDQLINEYPEILEGDIRMHCDCPSFQFSYQYNAYQLEFGMTPPDVNAPPTIRNPDDSGTVCKHLVAVLNRFFVS